MPAPPSPGNLDRRMNEAMGQGVFTWNGLLVEPSSMLRPYVMGTDGVERGS